MFILPVHIQLHLRFLLLAQVMRTFEKLSRRQRTLEIARVAIATYEHATRQLKKSQEKVARVEHLATKSGTLSLM